MTWVEDQINKEDIFPTTPGKNGSYTYIQINHRID